jgi:hypothetical protein
MSRLAWGTGASECGEVADDAALGAPIDGARRGNRAAEGALDLNHAQVGRAGPRLKSTRDDQICERMEDDARSTGPDAIYKRAHLSNNSRVVPSRGVTRCCENQYPRRTVSMIPKCATWQAPARAAVRMALPQ